MMKNVFFSAALMLLSISAFAQTADENLFSGPEDFDTYPREVYCEIESYTKRILTNKVAVKVDFGQEADFRYKDSRLVDENGADIDSGAVSTHWIMAKKVTSPDQIVEGLRTFRMTDEP